MPNSKETTPRVSFFERHRKFLSNAIRGLPQTSHANITKEMIQECVGKSDPTILEIGCNDGTQTLWFLEMFENPTIYCFEPDPRAIARYKAKVGQRSNVTLFELAMSDRVGDITFHQSDGQLTDELAKTMPEGWDLSGSIREPKHHLTAHPTITFEKSITVETTTLDAWCQQQGIGDIDFIWMDVQGAELDVFNGGTESLAKTRHLYTEYCNKELYNGQGSLKKVLKKLAGFEPLIRYPGDVLLRNKRLVGTEPTKALKQMLVDSHRAA